MNKPDYISDSDWKLVNLICNSHIEEPYLISAIGWHETHWGTIGAGPGGWHFGYGYYGNPTVAAKYKGLENQLNGAHRMIVSYFNFPVTQEAVTDFAVHHWKSSAPIAWAKSVYNQFINITNESKMNKDEKLTTNFLWGEFWSNNFGKPKVEPPEEYFGYIHFIATQLQKVRDKLNENFKPKKEIKILITSGYRTKEWNASKGVEGANNSKHLYGMAADSRAIGIPLMVYWSYILRYTDLNHLGFYKTLNFVHAGIEDKITIFKY